jgi:hypothetical protein
VPGARAISVIDTGFAALETAVELISTTLAVLEQRPLIDRPAEAGLCELPDSPAVTVETPGRLSGHCRDSDSSS